MMSGDDQCFVCGCTGPEAQCYGCNEFGHFAQDCPTKFLHQEHHATMADLTQGINTPTTGGTDCPPIMVPDIGDITADHNPAPVHTTTEASALQGTLHAFLPVIRPHHAELQLMDVPVTPHAILTPHPALATSPTGATPWTRTSLTLTTHTTQHKDPNPGKSSNVQDPQLPINPTTPKLSLSSIFIETLHHILTVMMTF